MAANYKIVGGLNGGHTNQPQKFTVETSGAGCEVLGLSIEGPSKITISCVNNEDGSCTVEYLPTKAGDYDVEIKFAEQNIPGSPFRVHITDQVNPQKVRCYGPGIEPKGVCKGQPGIFTVDATEAGNAPLDVTTSDPRGQRCSAQVNLREDGAYDVLYYPNVEGLCTVDVLYAGKPVPGSPFNTRILPSFDASKVIVSGDGVKPTGVLASLPTSFMIDTREAGLADLDVVIQDPYGEFVRPKIQDNGVGTYIVTYTPSEVGCYTVEVKFGVHSVPSAPFLVTTSPTGDGSKVKILDKAHAEDEDAERVSDCEMEFMVTSNTEDGELQEAQEEAEGVVLQPNDEPINLPTDSPLPQVIHIPVADDKTVKDEALGQAYHVLTETVPELMKTLMEKVRCLKRFTFTLRRVCSVCQAGAAVAGPASARPLTRKIDQLEFYVDFLIKHLYKMKQSDPEDYKNQLLLKVEDFNGFVEKETKLYEEHLTQHLRINDSQSTDQKVALDRVHALLCHPLLGDFAAVNQSEVNSVEVENGTLISNISDISALVPIAQDACRQLIHWLQASEVDAGRQLRAVSRNCLSHLETGPSFQLYINARAILMGRANAVPYAIADLLALDAGDLNNGLIWCGFATGLITKLKHLETCAVENLPELDVNKVRCGQFVRVLAAALANL